MNAIKSITLLLLLNLLPTTILSQNIPIEDVSGLNITRVGYQGGYFQQATDFDINNNFWFEHNKDGIHEYVEHPADLSDYKQNSRTKDLVYLKRKNDNNIILELNIKDSKIYYKEKGTAKRAIYNINNYKAGKVTGVTHMAAKPGVYYNLQLKTSKEYYLGVWNSGYIGASHSSDNELQHTSDYHKWLIIPTGDGLDNYWLFNKGAQSGKGQVMAKPQIGAKYRQWEFNPEDNAQVFKLEHVKDGYYRIINRGKTLSTRWKEAAFSWNTTEGDDQQLIKLVESEPIDIEKDFLSGFIYWNYDSHRIKNYFRDYCGFRPNPNNVLINEFVFINSSEKKVVPAVHRFGCAGIPWRNGLPQCGYAELTTNGQEYTFLISDYLKHSELIWGIIGWTGAIAAAVVVTVVTMGIATPAVAAALGTAGTTTAGATVSIMIGTQLTAIVLTVVDFAIITPGILQIVRNAHSISESDDIYVHRFFKDKGLNEVSFKKLNDNFDDDYFYAGGELFKKITRGFYLEETVSKKQITEMFYSSGKCVFIIK